MKRDLEQTTVVFRVFKDGGDLLALFPAEPWSGNGVDCAAYQHVGQHGPADYSHCIRATRPAKPSEYVALKSELEGLGYNLKIVSRYSKRGIR